MSDFTVAEIEKAIDAADLDWWQLEDVGDTFTVAVRGENVILETVDSDPGCEGHGETVYVVFKAGDQFFEKTAWYYSHYGTEWDGDLREVTPEQRTITVYVTK